MDYFIDKHNLCFESMKTLQGKMAMFLSNLNYAGHWNERWRDLKRYD